MRELAFTVAPCERAAPAQQAGHFHDLNQVGVRSYMRILPPHGALSGWKLQQRHDNLIATHGLLYNAFVFC